MTASLVSVNTLTLKNKANNFCQAQPNGLTKAVNWACWYYYHILHYPAGRHIPITERYIFQVGWQTGRLEKYFLAKIELGHLTQICLSQ